MHYLYRITNQLDGKVYIGRSNKETERWRQHKYFARQEKPIRYVHRAMKKYGIDNFVYEVIAVCLTRKDADELETQLIIRCDSRNNDKGYNIAPGGDHAWNAGLPKEKNPLTGRPRSEEIKRKISESSLGKIMPPATPERKKKMSDMYTGRKLPNEWVEKIAASNRGKIRSSETRLNISLAHIGVQAGEKHPMAKLNWEKVKSIRIDHSTGNYTHKRLGVKYGVSHATISDIVNNKIWKNDG